MLETDLGGEAGPPPGTDDGTLAALAREGDREAFRSLYERWAPPLLGLLARLLGDRTLAEDALQEAFAKAWRALASYDPSRPFGAWIRTIATNVGRDLLRARRPRGQLPEEDLPARGPEAHEDAERREREDVVREALVECAPEARRVLLLRYREGLTQREVAERLGCSVRTAQAREREALERLALLLEARGKGKEVVP